MRGRIQVLGEKGIGLVWFLRGGWIGLAALGVVRIGKHIVDIAIGELLASLAVVSRICGWRNAEVERDLVADCGGFWRVTGKLLTAKFGVGFGQSECLP